MNIVGRYDEETWEDQNTHEKKSAPVIIVDEIEFGATAQSGNGKQGVHGNGASAPYVSGLGNSTPAPNADGQRPATASISGQPENFTGFEGFGNANPYFPEP